MNTIGILGINKPQGMSSFDVVRKVKKETGIKKIGHGGTLDPMATGVLPILVNEATAFFDILLHSSKIYEAEIQLGSITDTDDKEGTIIQTLPVPDLTLDDILEQIALLTGDIMQMPPQYSALKVNGKRAYDLARAGEKVELQERAVSVFIWDHVSYDSQSQKIKARIHCGSGTYIRSLARDLAQKLGTGGHLTALRRLKSGGIDIKNTIKLENIATEWEQKLILPEQALDFLPYIEWRGAFSYILHGKPLRREFCSFPNKEGIYRLMHQEYIIALVEYTNNRLVYKKNLAHLYQNIII